ncbi:hypothetical protein [Nocardioides sp.]|uniref:hypothetical protein n=1 Tax=Nocardioides sp. TaxID=35761 RepID=UPI003D0CE34F
MELTQAHYDLLRAIESLQGDDSERFPSTPDVGARLLEIYKARGGVYSWHSSAPWHGTSPMADELRREGLIEVDVGIATFHHPSQPAASVDQYWIGITGEGRIALAKVKSGE